jgi:uncharacterized protein YndB with AHSA1/START domain
MAEIKHRIGINGSVSEVYQLLTTDAGLSHWWTRDTTGAGEVGSIIQFRFGDAGPDFEVIELIPDRLVRWRHSGEMPTDWEGTEIVFELEQQKHQAVLLFSHNNWEQSSSFLAHCSTKWGIFMMSIKSCIETGFGNPYPNDVHIDFDD